MAEPGASTRLIVLGCVRAFQPVHGYYVRRELTTWQVDRWANVHPGSIYGALRALTRAGLLEEVQTGPGTGRPTRTSYRLTAAGDEEFVALVRRGLLVHEDTALFLAALNMSSALPREEVLRALRARAVVVAGYLTATQASADSIASDPDTPDAVVEVPRMLAARARGELAWLDDLIERVEAGAYSYAGEPPAWTPSQATLDEVRAAGVGPWARVADETRNSEG